MLRRRGSGTSSSSFGPASRRIIASRARLPRAISRRARRPITGALPATDERVPAETLDAISWHVFLARSAAYADALAAPPSPARRLEAFTWRPRRMGDRFRLPVHTESRGDAEHPSDQVILNYSCPERRHGQDSLRSGMFP